jgi:hypothetical protein
MNIPLLKLRGIIEVILKRQSWILASLTTCTTQAYEGREYSLILFKSTVFDRNLVMLKIFAEWK